MGDFLVFERSVWFDTQVRQKRFPNARKLADFREIKLKILQFGADVEVISPEELRRAVRKEIDKMAKKYK